MERPLNLVVAPENEKTYIKVAVVPNGDGNPSVTMMSFRAAAVQRISLGGRIRLTYTAVPISARQGGPSIQTCSVDEVSGMDVSRHTFLFRDSEEVSANLLLFEGEQNLEAFYAAIRET